MSSDYAEKSKAVMANSDEFTAYAFALYLKARYFVNGEFVTRQEENESGLDPDQIIKPSVMLGTQEVTLSKITPGNKKLSLILF